MAQQPIETSTSQKPNIDDLRDRVDKIDHEIMTLLGERLDVARSIATEKARTSRPLRDDDREQAMFRARVERADSVGLDPGMVSRVWEQIVADSLRVQYELVQGRLNGSPAGRKVAIQGVEGSYSHIAARRLIGSDLRLLPGDTFSSAVDSVISGVVDVAVLPLDNTTSGAIAEVYDLIVDSGLSIVGEVKLLIEHCLLGVPGAGIEQIRTIYGHPQALTQCSEYLSSLNGVDIAYYGDTALSARHVASKGDPSVAAIASQEAAAIFGLEVLKTGIGNRRTNYTRFVVVALSPIAVDTRVPAKTSLVLSVSNEAGSLNRILEIFARDEINLVKLESRPTVDNPWEELFYLDLDGNLADPAVVAAIDAARRHARFLRVLGCYPSEDLRPTRRPRASSGQVTVDLSDSKPAEAKGYRLASKFVRETTAVEVGSVVIGDGSRVVIAGPCAVESFDQVMACAKAVKAGGAVMLRGGCFKPRTSPYSFQGLGYEGLEMLAEAGKIYGLPIVTEVPAPEHVTRMAELADVLQVGARNMQNFALLTELGMTRRPVLLKRGMSASIDELLQAAEYILAGGNQQVILCERGMRTFETATRNTLDLAAVPVLRARTHLPVIVDPSHAAGERSLVAPLARAAAAVGADGIIVEVHPDPANALSDGPQALDFTDFTQLMDSLKEWASPATRS